MKILLINNFHYYRAGAERAYLDMAKILEKNGHTVAFFSTNHSQTIPNKWQKYFVKYYELSDPKKYSFWMKVKITLGFFYKFEARRNLRKLLKEFQPDVAHLHNIFHHLTPAVIDELKKNNIPVVMTLHDFRFLSPNAILFSKGKNWEKDKGGKFYRCILDRCVHNSYAQSLITTLETYIHHFRRSMEKVDILLSPSRFLIEKSKELGFQKEIEKLNNFILFQSQDEKSVKNLEKIERPNWLPKGDYISFIARMSREKGAEDLLLAFSKVKDKTLSLVMMGDGPLKEKLISLAEEMGIKKQVKFFDYDKKKHDEIQKHSLAVLNPSRCYENAPYGILDAFLMAKPVIGTNHGGQKELIEDGENGFVFELGNAKELSEKIEKLTGDRDMARRMGERGKKLIEEKYQEKVLLEELLNIYQKAIERNKQ